MKPSDDQLLHLDDDDFAAALGGGADGRILAHLEACEACSSELARCAAAVGGVRAAFEAQVAAAPLLWQAREQAIVAQMRAAAAAPESAWWPRRLALVAAVVLVVGGPAVWWAERSAPVRDAVVSPMADEALLVGVEGALAVGTPVALAPLDQLAWELADQHEQGGS